jgi:hypothetical protein
MFKGLFEWFEGHKNVLKMAYAALLPNNIISYIYSKILKPPAVIHILGTVLLKVTVQRDRFS